jgi:hypothetical protein
MDIQKLLSGPRGRLTYRRDVLNKRFIVSLRIHKLEKQMRIRNHTTPYTAKASPVPQFPNYKRGVWSLRTFYFAPTISEKQLCIKGGSAREVWYRPS